MISLPQSVCPMFSELTLLAILIQPSVMTGRQEANSSGGSGWALTAPPPPFCASLKARGPTGTG